jgi:hypothetical protein
MRWLPILLVLFVLQAEFVVARSFFVNAATGTLFPGNSAGNLSMPWLSFSDVASAKNQGTVVFPGDSFFFHSGALHQVDYFQFPSGNVTNTISLSSYGGGTATFNCTGLGGGNTCLDLVDALNVQISNLVFIGQYVPRMTIPVNQFFRQQRGFSFSFLFKKKKTFFFVSALWVHCQSQNMSGVTLRDITISNFATGILVQIETAATMFQGIKNLNIQNVTITNNAHAGILIQDDRCSSMCNVSYGYSNITISDVSVRNILGMLSVGRSAIGILARFASYVNISRTLIDSVGGNTDFQCGGGILVEFSEYVTVDECAVQRAFRPSSDFATEWCPGILLGSGSAFCLISHNFISDIDGPGILLQQTLSETLSPNKNNTIRFNVVQRTAQRSAYGGISLDCQSANTSGLFVYSNTISVNSQLNVTTPSSVAVQLALGSAGSRLNGCAFFDNIFFANNSDMIRVTPASVTGTEITMRKNFWFSRNVTTFFYTSGSTQFLTIGAFLAATSLGDDFVNDPQLMALAVGEPLISSISQLATLTAYTPLSPTSNCLSNSVLYSALNVNDVGLTDFRSQPLVAGSYGVGAFVSFVSASTTAQTTSPSVTTLSSNLQTTSAISSCPSGTSCSCFGGDCVVSDLEVLIGATQPIFVPSGSRLTFLGNLTCSFDALTLLGSFDPTQPPSLVVRGRASVGGILRLVTSSSTRVIRSASTATVLQADGGVVGTFSTVEASSTASCASVAVANSVYSASSMSVTLTVTPCPGGIGIGVIVGIAIGASAVVALVLIIILIMIRKNGGKSDQKKFAKLQRIRSGLDIKQKDNSRAIIIEL